MTAIYSEEAYTRWDVVTGWITVRCDEVAGWRPAACEASRMPWITWPLLDEAAESKRVTSRSTEQLIMHQAHALLHNRLQCQSRSQSCQSKEQVAADHATP